MRLSGLILTLLAGLLAAAEPLRVCATVTDLGSLVRRIGGDAVQVTTFASGVDDPHFVEPRPSYVKDLARADVFIMVGLELEIGWVPGLLQQAGNARFAPGRPGFIDAGTAITPLGIPKTPVDRSHGDVHASGNPHYLSDPVNGWRVATVIAARLAELLPDQAALFQRNLDAFECDLAARLVGAELATALGAHQALTEVDAGKIPRDGLIKPLGGWLARCAALGNPAVVVDHDAWPYFARRFGLRITGFIEPKPGIPPSAKHLSALVEQMQRDGVMLLVTSTFFDRKPVEVVARRTGARLVELAPQSGALPGTEDYLDWIASVITTLAPVAPP